MVLIIIVSIKFTIAISDEWSANGYFIYIDRRTHAYKFIFNDLFMLAYSSCLFWNRRFNTRARYILFLYYRSFFYVCPSFLGIYRVLEANVVLLFYFIPIVILIFYIVFAVYKQK